MENGSNRHVGRPKGRPQTGPLVLEGSRSRSKLEIEVAEATADELKEYSRWVELSSSLATGDAVFTTVDYALRELFRRDRLWQERQRKGERRESSVPSQTSPVQQATPASLPPPASSGRAVPGPTAPPAPGERRSI
ncbi:MAG: hypothetical protein ABI560_04255 [Myxococcales bacterium]